MGPSVNLNPSASLKIFGFKPMIFVYRRVFAHDFNIDFTWCNHHRPRSSFVKIEPGIVQINEVCRRTGDWTIDTEDCQLNLLAWLDVPADDQAVGCVPPRDNRS